MRVTIHPCAITGKSVTAPPSKSMAHRMLICAGLAEGTSVIRNIAASEDILATMDCLRALGADIAYSAEDMTATVRGTDPHAAAASLMPCRESGSTLRFMIPLCALSASPVKLTGSGRLMQRPLSVYEDMLKEQGILIEKDGDEKDGNEKDGNETDGDALTVSGGPLRGGAFSMPGDVSSQFVSGMLFALPLCGEDSVIRLEGSVESRPYIDMTIQALREYGVQAEWMQAPGAAGPNAAGSGATGPNAAGSGATGPNATGSGAAEAGTAGPNATRSGAAEAGAAGPDAADTDAPDRSAAVIKVPGAQRYRAADAVVEGDWSNAANLIAAGADVEGVDPQSLQGDKVCAEYFRKLEQGCAELDISDCPDLGPVLMACAAANHGATLTGTKRLRYKESDRGLAMQTELAKFGIETCVDEDSITVGSGPQAPQETLSGHNDHRIVMALTALCLRTGGSIDGAEAVSKSFPDYFEKIGGLGAVIEKENGNI